jgi:dienelactone hydrolase
MAAIAGLSACVALPAVAAPTHPAPTHHRPTHHGPTSPGPTAGGTDWTQPCGGRSWVGGSTDICDGTVVYRDYVYDDEGADTGGVGYDTNNTSSAFGTLAMPAGDVRYPPGDVNTADLVRLELTRVGDRVQVTAQLNALFRPNSTILAIAVDTDDNAKTGGGTWSGLGVSSTGWDKLYKFDVGNVKTNIIRGSFPLPKTPRWRVQAATAYVPPSDAFGPVQVMNVSFRGVDEQAAYNADYTVPSPYPPTGKGAWFEDKQAAALASGDISQFGYTVTTSDLRPGVTELQHVGPGFHERVYTSNYTLPPGEGMSYDGIEGRGDGGSVKAFNQVFNFLGPYQPYGIYIPHKPGPHGLQMEWHGSNQGITGQINQPGMQQRFGEDLNRLLVVPEARGPNGYGSDISERDLLDVMNDVEKSYDVDRSRVFSSGYSQGGYLAFRMAMLWPDRFAGFTSWVGFTGDDMNGTSASGTVSAKAGAVGNMIDYVANLRNVPGSMLYSGEDELVQVPSSMAMLRAFEATDDTFVWWMHPVGDHFTYALLDNWAKEAAYSAKQRLVTDPMRVTFATDRNLDAPKYGIRHDSAYWLSHMRTRKAGQGTVDLTSAGCGGAVPTMQTGNGAGVDPVPWVSDYQQPVGTTKVAAAPKLSGSLTNVRSVRIDTDATCLQHKTIHLRIKTDGPTTLTLSDGRTITWRGAGLHDETLGSNDGR